ncbi:hypothetical protein ANO14919_125350 [Xylariales sp. No.14919]|nr:hypothetical protein ANO14919_125350 [Xylariales sp. No.14919]
MCGDNHSRDSIGGALAVMGPSQFITGTSPMPMAGRLVFHNKTKGSTLATHAMFTADSSRESQSGVVEPCLVRIHETGDLTRPATTSPLWATFSLKPILGALRDGKAPIMEVVLERPMKIEVGGDGVIGRRVSVWTQQGAGPIAEGIVGYN